MFHHLHQLGELHAGETAKQSFIAQTNREIDGQDRRMFEAASVELHEHNMGLLGYLHQAGQDLDMPGVIEAFNAGIDSVPDLRKWGAHAEPFSWVAHAPAQIGADFSPVDGMRVAHGWRIHWANRSKNAPPEMAVLLYQRQVDGQLEWPRMAVVPHELPRTSPYEPPQTILGALAAETAVLYEFKRLAAIARTPAYEDLTNRERGQQIAQMRAIVDLFRATPSEPSPDSRYLSLFITHRSNVGWTERPDSESKSSLILQKPYRSAAEGVLELAFEQEATDIVLPGSPEAGGVPYQSYDLAEINDLFAPSINTKKWLGMRSVRVEGGAIGNNSWKIGAPILAQFELERANVAERLERLCLESSTQLTLPQ